MHSENLRALGRIVLEIQQKLSRVIEYLKFEKTLAYALTFNVSLYVSVLPAVSNGHVFTCEVLSADGKAVLCGR